MGSAVPAATRALVAAWQARITANGVLNPDGSAVTVSLGFPADIETRHFSCFVSGRVTDWNQNWGVTQYQGDAPAALQGGIDETFVLTAGIHRRRIDGTLDQLLTDVDSARAALEQALRVDRTLAGALSPSGRAILVSGDVTESVSDDRTREIGLQLSIRCEAWITP